MKTQHTLWIAALPLVAALTTVTPHSFAQSSGKAPAGQAASAPDRAQIKKETAEANQAHRLEHGEAGDSSAAPPDKTKARQSPVSRTEVRKETAAANKAHRLEHGEAGDSSAAPPDKAKAKVSTVKRADVKKETAAANKAGTLPHGEVEGQPATKP